ncbi:MAG: ABC transporter substrate-binding protein [Lachnospiraceae bacterium]|nr:ABC transporter substrate-binding protein [Lachnospiraceae bacterium]
MKKKIAALAVTAAMIFGLAACSSSSSSAAPETKAPETEAAETEAAETEAPETEAAEEEVAQGVTDTTIYIGNTAATTGAYATVGVPFNAGLEAALKQYNDAGGFNGLNVELIHYDDGFDAGQGLTYTKTLVETDKVFAIVGNFGTNTVGANLDYLKEVGVPMVYAATGISALYNVEATGNERCIMPVQPIYDAEGRVLLARALATEENGLGLGGTKVGVIATTDDAGTGMLDGVKYQAELGSIELTIQEVAADATDFNAAITVLMNAGCDVVIAAMNQAPLVKALNAMRDLEYNVKVITSYVNASATTLGALVADGSITAERPVYATSWLDLSTEEGVADYTQFATVMLAYEAAEGITETYSGNSYAIAGYIAGLTFLAGLERVQAAGQTLTWANYIDAMESEPISIPMGGSVDYANGARLGLVDLALNTIGLEADENGAYALVTVDHITPLEDVWAAIQ